MTDQDLRDEIAVKVLLHILAMTGTPKDTLVRAAMEENLKPAEKFAEQAYFVADCMIRARRL